MASLRREARAEARRIVRLFGRTYTHEGLHGVFAETVREAAQACDHVINWADIDWPEPTALEMRRARDDRALASALLDILEV